MDEARLGAVVARARQGDPGAQAEIYTAFARRVFGLCRNLLGSAQEAEEATSEVFLRVQKRMGTYDASSTFPAWLLSIAAHHCVDRLRRRQVESRLFTAGDPEHSLRVAGEVETVAGSTVESPLKQLLAREEQAAVRKAIAGLPERWRVPLVLRYYGDLSYDQIAATLGLSRNNVAILIFRAKQELRRALATRSVRPGPPSPTAGAES